MSLASVYVDDPISRFHISWKSASFCKLYRGLYGLQSCVWCFEVFVLLKIGFVKFEACNFFSRYNFDRVLLLYVEGIAIFGKNKKVIEGGFKLLGNHFDLKILGKDRKLLGVEFN